MPPFELHDDDLPATLLAHAFDAYPNGGVASPVYQNSLFTFPDLASYEAAQRGEGSAYLYSRASNPTVRALEHKVAALQGAEAARAFGSGMGAIAAAVLGQVHAGAEVIAIEGIYGVTRLLLERYLPRFGVTVRWVSNDPSDAELDAARSEHTRLLVLESPSSVVMVLQDLARCAAWARRHDVVTVIDNTWATPLHQRPHELGVDLVCHTASKYLGGHSDLVAGVVTGTRERIKALTDHEAAILGATLGPWDAWLVMRGLRTLDVRLERHEASALTLARWLEGRPEVARVLHPGLPSHPQHDLFRRQMTGSCGLFSVVLDLGEAGIRRFVEGLRLFGIGVSWGGFESLALPLGLHMQRPPFERFVPPGLVRLHVGLEAVEDLQRDLEQALHTAARAL